MSRSSKTLQAIFLQVLIIIAFAGSVIAQPLSGTYIIGSGSGAHFASPVAAASALQLNGVSGPVIFQIDSGTYTGQFSLGSISGSNSINTVIFRGVQGDSTQVRLIFPSSASSLNNFVVDLSGTSNIAFENLSMERSGQDQYARVLTLSGNVQNLRIESCQIVGASSNNTGLHQILLYGTLNSGPRNILITDSYFNGGNYGVFLLGPGQFSRSSQIIVEECHFENQFAGNLRLSYFASPLVVRGNRIFSEALNSGFNGIHLDNCANEYRIESNWLGIATGTGIRIALSSGFSVQIALIANNIIQADSGAASPSAVTGINLSNSSTIHLYHNSIHLEQAAGGICFSLSGIACSNIGMLNNNFTAGNGLVLDIDTAAPAPFNNANHNNLNSYGPHLIRRGSASLFSNLSSYQIASGLEQGSMSIAPNFLPVWPSHNTPELDDAGSGNLSNLTPVNYDFQGHPRNSSAPDIGALEFEHFRMGIDELFIDSTLCTGDSAMLKVRLKNFGPGAFPFQFSGSISIDSLAPITWPLQPSAGLAGGDTLLLNFPLALQFSNSPKHVVKLNFSFEYNPPAYQSDSLSSDTIRIRQPFVGFLGNDTTICLSHTLLISSTQSFSSYSWSNGSNQATLQVLPNSLPVGSYPIILSGLDEYCLSQDTIQLSIDACHGLDETHDESLKVYPNPALSMIVMDLPPGVSEIKIIDAAGRLVWTGITTESRISIDINTLRPGYHHIHVINSCAYLHCSFVKL